ncbi:MAG: dihydrofolate reductase [Phycisphaeraceae bacterium]|nr:MAG: dihydrofolate reductase [Phycisphaeraceae bacterium]
MHHPTLSPSPTGEVSAQRTEGATSFPPLPSGERAGGEGSSYLPLPSPMLVAVAAMGTNRVIGRDGGLPWRLPDELKYFKRVTLGRVVIMGRRTFSEELGGALPGRTNIVITRQPDWAADAVKVCRDLGPAIALAQELAGPENWPDLDRCPAILGGGSVYAQALPLVDRLYLTEVHAEPEGDTTFPELDPAAWAEITSEYHPADDRHAHAFTMRVLDRLGPGH